MVTTAAARGGAGRGPGRLNRAAIDRLGEEIVAAAVQADVTLHRMLTALRRFDAEEGWGQQGALTCAHWLAWRVGLDLCTAREHVRVARALGAFPRIDEAFRAGQLSYSKVRAITRVATPETEVDLLELAEASTGSQLEVLCRRFRGALRNIAGVSPACPPDRYVRHYPTDDGMVRIVSKLLPDEAALVLEAIEVVRREALATAAQARAEPASERGVHTEPLPADPPSRSSGEESPSRSSGEEPPARTSAEEPPSRSSGEESPARTSAEEPPSRSSAEEPPSRSSAEESPSRTSGEEPPARTSAEEPPARTSAEEPPSRSSAEVLAPAPGTAGPDEVPGSTDASTSEPPAEPAQRVVPGRATRPNLHLPSAADALVELAARFLAGGDAASGGRPLFEVSVLVEEATLRGTSEAPAVVGRDLAAPAETARRLACDAALVEVVCDERGLPVEVGRRTRTIPPALRRALRLRDGGCSFPGCTNHLFVDAHHVRHWAQGGSTTLANTTLLCRRHHGFVHEGGFRVVLEDGGAVFFGPDGRRIDVAPARTTGGAATRRDGGDTATGSRPPPHWDGERPDYGAAVEALVDRVVRSATPTPPRIAGGAA